MTFDCLNEVLDSYRPYGFSGQPYPWKNTVRLTKPVPITEKNMGQLLEKAKKQVLEWAQLQCGYYGDKDEFLQDKTSSFCEEYLAQIKEDKLAKMLQQEVDLREFF